MPIGLPRFLTVEQIRAKYEDLGQATLHGTPPGDWFQRWMDDVGTLLAAVQAAERARGEASEALLAKAFAWVLDQEAKAVAGPQATDSLGIRRAAAADLARRYLTG